MATKDENKQVTDNDIDKLAQRSGDILADQEKVTVKLFLPPEEKTRLQNAVQQGVKVDWPAENVIVNGYTYTIQKGKEVEVPQTVAEILEQAGLI